MYFSTFLTIVDSLRIDKITNNAINVKRNPKKRPNNLVRIEDKTIKEMNVTIVGIMGDGLGSPNHQETKKPFPKGAPQISKI